MAKNQKEKESKEKEGEKKKGKAIIDTKYQYAQIAYDLDDIEAMGLDKKKATASDVAEKIKEVFKKAGIELPERKRSGSQKSKKGRALLKALDESQIDKLIEKFGVEVADE